MKKIRKNHDAAYKAKVALEAVKGEKTIGQLSSKYGANGAMTNARVKQKISGLI